MSSLANTQTLQNLISAIVRESQVSISYNLYSGVALKEGYWEISEIFSTIASQEQEHYEVFLHCIPEAIQNQQMIAQTPIFVAKGTTAQNIVSALSDEVIATTDYPSFATIAMNEGFPDISAIFINISSVEKYHHSLYEKLQYNLKNNETFHRDRTVVWQCCACGFMLEAGQAPSPCPVCGNVGSYKYYGDNMVLYMTFNEPDGTTRTVIVENEDPRISIADISNKMDIVISSGMEGPSLTKDNAVVSVQNGQRYDMNS